jgi:hypothetical protein
MIRIQRELCLLRDGRGVLGFLLVALAAPAFGAAAVDGSVVAAGLVRGWPDDGHANAVADATNGTLNCGPTATTPGVVGQAFSFDGANDYGQITDALSRWPANLMVAAWVCSHSPASQVTGESA